MYTHSKLKQGIFLETDTDQDDIADDFSWIKADQNQKENFIILYNETRANDQTTKQTWYGPGNTKIIEKTDENKDGYFETTTYYNRFAKPQVARGIVARIEIDASKNNLTNIWLYPGVRMEKDTNGDGIADCFNQDIIEIQNAFGSKDNLSHLQSLPCSKFANPNFSFAIHPEQIKEDRLKAIIPFRI
ncbi:hypothetical protein [Leptospira sp. 'Mane']|uniref:Lsa25.6 family adhesin n=1 Tax=Leptospira sp. 'Mane' TaxID=3387407 RepID=UPI00398AAD78